MRTGGRILALSAALVVLTACGARSAVPPVQEPPPVQQRTLAAPSASAESCGTGLKFTAGEVEAASGLRVMPVELLNCGTQPVELNGYPQVKLHDDQWRPLAVDIVPGSGGIAVLAGFDDPPQSVTVQPGERARTAFLWRNTHTSVEPPLVGGHADIALTPDGAWQALVPESGGNDLLIDLGSTGRMGVRAWRR
ncbi:DUF4232 domain-containing protein [Lentzea fradiae]|nr:DUF4232 domain-containing protein [Lentzea fradiae]